MHAKKFLAFALTAVVAAGGGWFAAREAAHVAGPAPAADGRRLKFYQSPMHPWITSDRPGKCTICGMNLAAVYEGDAGYKTDEKLVTLAPANAAVVGMQTAAVRRAALTRTLRVAGMIDDDATQHRYISARVAGRVEHLHVHTTGVAIAAGAPFATLYSPDVLSAERFYVERLKAGPAAFTVSETASARERLLQLGLTPDEVANLEKTQQPDALVTVRAPFAGTVIAVNEAAHEGGYLKEGDLVFTLADFSSMWFVFDAYEADLPWLRVGQNVAVMVGARHDELRVAPIAFIDPNLDEATHTARVRVVLPNADGKLLHRQLGHAQVQIDSPPVLLVPRSAVLHTSAQPLVFVDKDGHAYEPRTVRLGRAGDNDYEVIDGLAEGDRVVTQGALLLDAQAQIARPSPTSSPPM